MLGVLGVLGVLAFTLSSEPPRLLIASSSPPRHSPARDVSQSERYPQR